MSLLDRFHSLLPPSLLSRTLFTPALLSLLSLYFLLPSHPQRPQKLSPKNERVLILGGSSGIGRAIARIYARRGARVCVVGRREGLVKDVVEECQALGEEGKIIGMAADFADVHEMVQLRETLEREWQGLDTLIVAAGVSALRPLLEVAGVDSHSAPGMQATAEGIQHTVDVAVAALRGNYVGPLVAAVTFIPLLQNTSPTPSLLLLSSLAALTPPPTRTLYASTKSASLTLYQSLSTEHPLVQFTLAIPYTVEGDFRASAVDGGAAREGDTNKTGLKREDVARRCVRAVDQGERTVWLPGWMRIAHALYWIWPGFVEGRARRKYGFGV